ncbi:CDP-glycerol--poly(glycerophosphate) glycerophosphotransferase [Pseudomonas sp. MRSN 12121]|uniref:CDP-glycerol--poly(glycerophosphate) glycerophosphotransferase n=1 Tax=Pseudomonas sp. MRSN 12121 TaxID=1611770 RepID=UPI0005BEBBFE|nr:CDP-glycerol--poly(glycerophosphate) glycerophosphotransferase [Pseudomonas sp. MRSN 12121]AJO81376.1 CDP-glycerol:poly(glycerophosphate) glycerophosphotransferase family protein [Pseudomonas sp. MRSN 12121]
MTAPVPSSRLAFFVHTAEMVNHYQAVWSLLGADAFEVVLHGSREERTQSRTLIEGLGYRCHGSLDAINSGHRYEVVVSNHSMFDHGTQPIIKALGHRQVRFMYALGKARHNFSDWNQHYDLILCFGPWQAERMRQCCNAVTFQMGYPRYDAYFREPWLQGAHPPDLALDPTKKTVLWLPTWLELSSISRFADAMAGLCERYNVIVKTHPLSAEADPEALAVLERYRFTAVITRVYDNLTLFRCADYVVSDYGGTAFGALYLDKNLLLLNVPDAGRDALTGEESPDVLLRNDIVNLDPEARWQLADRLEDECLWQEQAAVRQRLRRHYFAPSYGFSAELVVLALQNIENILKQG